MAGISAIQAAPASATVGTITTDVDTTTVTTQTDRTETAECPAGSTVIGAGWQALYSDGVVIDEAIPDTTTDSVTVEAYDDENGAPNAWALQARAICATGISNVEVVHDAGSLFDSVSPKSDTVSCPFPKKVVGVGFEIANNTAEGEVHVTKVDPSSSSLTVTAYEDDTYTGANWSVAAYAVCATEPFGLTVVPSPSPAYVTDMTTCPAGKVAVGAGADLGLEAPRDLSITTLKIGTYGGSDYALVSGREDTDGTNVNWDIAAKPICVYA